MVNGGNGTIVQKILLKTLLLVWQLKPKSKIWSVNMKDCLKYVMALEELDVYGVIYLFSYAKYLF